MKTRRTLIFSMLVFVLGLSLLMMGSPRQANALTQAEWETVADYLDAHLNNQWGATDDGEAGFIYPPATYKSAVDSNGDGNICSVGDDIKNRPVLVDNLWGTATLIPGTSVRNNWTQAGASGSGFSADTVAAIKARVDAHIAAGFSTDIVVY